MTMLRPRRTTTAREAGFADTPQSAGSALPPYTMASPASAHEARRRVEQLVEGLQPGGVDEGTGAALDRLIASWAAGWLAGIDAEHADHTGTIDRLIGSAREQVADARADHEHQALRLEIARQEHTDTRQRLGGTPPRPVTHQPTADQHAVTGPGIDRADHTDHAGEIR